MFNIKLYADGANITDIQKLSSDENIAGFTTNPTLMKAAGIKDYATFAKEALKVVGEKPISFEVFSDEKEEMKKQALFLADLAENVYVKIPVTNTSGTFMGPLITELSAAGVKLNITAIFTIEQITDVVNSLLNSNSDTPSIISIFAGRIADTGVDPVPTMTFALRASNALKACEVLWASPREVLNVYQANDSGCHIITATPSILKKLQASKNKDLSQFSLETVKMFYNDAQAAGYSL